MALKQRIEFGNYTLNFGNNKVLLDFFSEIVNPSFAERRYVDRRPDGTEFFFLDTKFLRLELDDNSWTGAIAGRIVKNSTISRDQIYTKTDGIVTDRKVLETAPTSVFVILLDCHRILFCREVVGAPTLASLRITSGRFLKKSWREYLEELYEEKKEQLGGEEPPKNTKAKLQSKVPPPELRITPLTDKESLEEFIERFSTVEELVITLLKTNNEEIDNDDFWRDLVRKKEKLNSPTTKVRFANAKEGLEADQVLQEASAATDLGNSDVRMKGHDLAGSELKGDNEEFRLSVEIDALPKPIARAAKSMNKMFRSLVETGQIPLPAVAVATLQRIQTLLDGDN